MDSRSSEWPGDGKHPNALQAPLTAHREAVPEISRGLSAAIPPVVIPNLFPTPKGLAEI